MKMVVMTTVLLFLLCVVVEVHSQTYPFVRFGNTGPVLSNHSYLDLTAVGESVNGSDTVQCVTDLGTCCHGAFGTDRGDWYFPNGTRLSLSASFSRDSIVEKRYHMRVELHYRPRINNGVANGIYQCTIETNAVNDEDGREIVYVGLYASGGEIYILHACAITFSFIYIVHSYNNYIITSENRLLKVLYYNTSTAYIF